MSAPARTNVRRYWPPWPWSWSGRVGLCAIAVFATTGYCHRAAGRAVAAPQTDGTRAVCLAWVPGTSRACPPVEEIEAAVRAMLRHPVPSPGTCPTRVTGSFHPDPGNGWRVDLHFASETGESLGNRSLEIRDAACSALKEPLSLIIALMLEGNAADNGPLRLPKPPSPARGDGVAGGGMVSMSTGAAVSSGLLPDVGFGATLGVGSRAVAGLPFRLDATFWFPTVKTMAGHGGQFWAVVGGLGFCPSFFQSRYLRAAVCLRMAAGFIHGSGLGLTEVGDATRPVGEGEATVTVAMRLSRQAAVYVSGGVAAPWLRSRFVYLAPPNDTRVEVHAPDTLIPLAALGLEFGAEETPATGATRP